MTNRQRPDVEHKTISAQAASRLSVAPMMDWTDRHCRVFHRMMSHHALLYTEMVTAQAVLHGPRDRLLGFDAREHPVALQLGGSDPRDLAAAAAIGADYGYDEINLNCGCPSDRVQSGAFGAVLMKSPALVADCVAAMQATSHVEVTVKCRIGVDDQEPAEGLPAFLETLQAAGVRRVQIHARKAWLKGLSPHENRTIPPLDHDLVVAMKQAFPDLHVSINGGITTLADVTALLARGLDGVMIGRAAYHAPNTVLIGADAAIFGAAPGRDAFDTLAAMRPYIADHLAQGGRLHTITRHMLGLFTGQPGARAWRRVLSTEAGGQSAGLEVLDRAEERVRAALDIAQQPEPWPTERAAHV